MGVPLITFPGETFASRVAASLLTAVELPQLIAENLEAYEALAVHLATHPQELAEIKQHLQSNRLQLPFLETYDNLYKSMIICSIPASHMATSALSSSSGCYGRTDRHSYI